MKTGILWDLDGTLLNSLEDLQDAVNYALGQYGCPERSLEQVRRFVGNGAAKLIQLALPGTEKDPPWQQVLATYQAYYAENSRNKTRPYAGIPAALEALAGDYPMAVVSNKPDLAVKALCREFFPGLYALGEAAPVPRKPAPDMLHKAMQALGVEKCLYVGDSEVDVRTAENAGVPCLSVTWGFRDEKTLQAAGARYFCHSPQLLEKTVREILE